MKVIPRPGLMRSTDTFVKVGSATENVEFDVIVFSHLRWEFVTQRPQHLMAELARSSKILFVEEPLLGTSTEAKLFTPIEGVFVLQPAVPLHDTKAFTTLVNTTWQNISLKKPVLWFYSPMFVECATYIPHELVVYDCMDELSLFKGASSEMKDKEKQLLQISDLVFTGGKALFEAKKQLHANIYCFPSAIDREHFEKSFQSQTLIPDDIKAIAKPVVGYYGVIDERIDLLLIQDLAVHAPEVAFVMIGPVVKISESELPRESNIYYLGPKQYSDLPAYLAAFDVAFMPFALNDATKFISPTKTLEFIAARKPIISTPITDVVRDYTHIVTIAKTATEFLSAINRYLCENEASKIFRAKNSEKVLGQTSWVKTAAAMQACINNSLALKKLYEQI